MLRAHSQSITPWGALCLLISLCGLQVSRGPIVLSDDDASGSAGADSDFVASDSEDEAADAEAESPAPVKRAYQTHVKNRALAGDLEIIEEEAQEDKYQYGEPVVPACTYAAGECDLIQIVHLDRPTWRLWV